MLKTTYVRHENQISQLKKLGITEVILEHQKLSRFGELSTLELQALAQSCRQAGLSCLLEWDAMASESQLLVQAQVLEELDLKLFRAIRVQDAGALELVLERTELPLQLILEAGHHNLLAIQTRCEIVGERLDRVILSLELPLSSLSEYIQRLSCPVEWLVFGPILLFYSPRRLLEAQSDLEGAKQVWASSEETPHKNFLVLENDRGSFMFHPKSFFVLEYLAELEDEGLTWARFDLRFYPQSLVLKLRHLFEQTDEQRFEQFKQQLPVDCMRGFFHSNRSDVIFKKLKNQKLQEDQKDCRAEVLSISRPGHMAVQLRKGQCLRKGEKHWLKTPEGKRIGLSLVELLDVSGRPVEELQSEQLGFVNFVKGAVPRGLILGGVR